MNWDKIEGNWKKFAGNVKQRWADLTDDDIRFVQGRKQELIGRIQERYGIAKEEAAAQVREWLDKLEESFEDDDEGRRAESHPPAGTAPKPSPGTKPLGETVKQS